MESKGGLYIKEVRYFLKMLSETWALIQITHNRHITNVCNASYHGIKTRIIIEYVNLSPITVVASVIFNSHLDYCSTILYTLRKANFLKFLFHQHMYNMKTYIQEQLKKKEGTGS